MADHASSTPSQTQFSAADLDTHHDLRGLAELAFGSLTRADEPLQGQHLALLHAESLELDLNDPAQRQFGDYELWELLGEGGMGAVYRARHKPLDRDVAVKLLSAGPWASKDFIARFEREAQSAARMQHPNIVTVFETGQQDGLHFFSMRLIEGFSLSVLLKRGERFTPKATAGLMRTLAEAVAYAHSLGVLHLDLKPGNVLIDAQGTAYVADFGLARRLDSAAVLANDEVSGTPAYMAPEQAQVRSSRLTTATDVWGLGAILYELLTGSPPFRADTAQGTLKLVLGGEVRPPRRLRPSVPMDLQAIVLRCLARDPRERYVSARELADDLARYVDGRPVLARPLNAMQRLQRWARREPRLAATAALAFLILVVGLVVSTAQWRRAQASAVVARDNLWATRAQSAEQDFAAGNGFAALRPLIANLGDMQAAGRTAEAAVERTRIGTLLANAPQLLDVLPLPPGEIATALAIAPDEHHFAVATRQTGAHGRVDRVRQYDLATLRPSWSATVTGLTHLRGGDGEGTLGTLRYTADGRFLLTSTLDQPVMPAPRRSDMLALATSNGHALLPTGLSNYTDIVFADDLQWALVRYRSEPSLRWPDSAQFYRVDGWQPTGPRHTVATTLAADIWLPAPHADTWLGTRDSASITLYRVPDLAPLWNLGLPQTSLVRSWQFSHDGRWIALGSVDGAVRLVDAASGHSRMLGTTPAERVQWVQFSADDRTLAALDQSGQLWTWNVATGAPRSAPRQILHGPADRARLRFADDTLVAGDSTNGGGELVLASLPAHARFSNQAVPVAARLPGPYFLSNSFGVAPTRRMLVSVSAGSLIEVWQIAPPTLLAARAAPLLPQEQAFDGGHVVSVTGDTVRVVNVDGGSADSPPLVHPEPVRFAELSPDGGALVTIAGRTVRVIDPATWKLRGQAIVLPQTPMRAMFARAAPVLLLTMAEYQGDVLRERLQRIDLRRGTLLGKALHTDWLNKVQLDSRGHHVLYWTWNYARKTETGPLWVDMDTGKTVCRVRLGDGVTDFELAPDGNSAWFDVGDSHGWSMRRWNLMTCRELASHDYVRATWSPTMSARADGSLVLHRSGDHALVTVAGDGHVQASLGKAVPEAMHDFAVSEDGRLAAIATRNAVRLLDAHDGRVLAADLAVPLAGDDAIARLTFSVDGTRLLGRSINGRWLLWRLPPTQMGTATLNALARVLDPQVNDAPSSAELAALRATLRRSQGSASAQASAQREPPARQFPAAANAAGDPRFVPLDLRGATNISLVGASWSEPFARGDRPTLAPGPQRFLGVDYRIDGGVQLSGGGTALAIGPELHRSATVAVPDVVATRVHVLAFMHVPVGSHATSRPFGYVVLTGSHGREARLEIRTVRDVITDVQPAAASVHARMAAFGISAGMVRMGFGTAPASYVYAVRLDVPADLGPIHALRFETAAGSLSAPLFYAATLERPPPTPN